MKIKNGVRVQIKNSYSYSGKHSGKCGTVYNYYGTDNIAVRIDSYSNTNSKYGLFYFNREELDIISYENKSDKNELRIVGAKHSSRPNQMYVWNVPPEISKIEVCDILKVETRFGIEAVTAQTQILTGDDAVQLLKDLAINTPAKSIISIVKTCSDVWKIPSSFYSEYFNFNNEKENVKMRTIGILDLWKKEWSDKYTEKHCEEINKIIDADSRVALIKSHVDEIKRIVFENGFGEVEELPDSFARQFTTDIVDGGVNQIDEDYRVKCEKLNKRYYEIKTMLSACDTYEQEMDVLKSYGVIDENDVLVKGGNI